MIPIELPDTVVRVEIKSLEREIQQKREQTTLAVLLFNNFLPDTPTEPDAEPVSIQPETKLMPLDEIVLPESPEKQPRSQELSKQPQIQEDISLKIEKPSNDETKASSKELVNLAMSLLKSEKEVENLKKIFGNFNQLTPGQQGLEHDNKNVDLLINGTRSVVLNQDSSNSPKPGNNLMNIQASPSTTHSNTQNTYPNNKFKKNFPPHNKPWNNNNNNSNSHKFNNANDSKPTHFNKNNNNNNSNSNQSGSSMNKPLPNNGRNLFVNTHRRGIGGFRSNSNSFRGPNNNSDVDNNNYNKNNYNNNNRPNYRNYNFNNNSDNFKGFGRGGFRNMNKNRVSRFNNGNFEDGDNNYKNDNEDNMVIESNDSSSNNNPNSASGRWI